jgi:hypothetical protein
MIKKKMKKKIRVRTKYITAIKKTESEIENIIEANENIVDKNFSEINGYHADKAGKIL